MWSCKNQYGKTLVIHTVLLFSCLKLWHRVGLHNVAGSKIKVSRSAKPCLWRGDAVKREPWSYLNPPNQIKNKFSNQRLLKFENWLGRFPSGLCSTCSLCLFYFWFDFVSFILNIILQTTSNIRLANKLSVSVSPFYMSRGVHCKIIGWIGIPTTVGKR